MTPQPEGAAATPNAEPTTVRLARELRERHPERIPRIVAELTRRIAEREKTEAQPKAE